MSDEYLNSEQKNTEQSVQQTGGQNQTGSTQSGQSAHSQTGSTQSGQSVYSQTGSTQSGQNTYSQTGSTQSVQNTYGQAGSTQNGQNTYSWVRREYSQQQNSQQQNAQTNWNGQPHYNYYQHRQVNAQQANSKRQKGRWATVVAMALVFGLIAGTVTYGINLVGNRLYPAVPQTEAAAPAAEEQKETTLSVAKTESGSSTQAVPAGSTQTVAKVAEEAMPSLVTIATVSVQEMQSFFGVQQFEAKGAGTGVIVGENDTELLIATNEHVISGANEVSVGFIDEEVVSAQVKGEDASTDLAIVSIKKEDIPAETLDKIKIAVIGNSDDLVLGEQVVAIGNALGVGQSVTSGYVSALNRELDLSDGMNQFVSSDLIQTDAAINSGNSGGALLNMNGELIGINEAKSAYTSSGVTVDNVGYAIPMSKAQPILEELMNQVTRESYSEDEQGYLGVSLADVSSDMAKLYNMPEGVCFTAVAEGSPAAEAGAQKGDVLTEVNGRSITDATSLMREMTYYKSGETIEMKVLRADNGEYKEMTLTVTLGTKDVLDALSAE